MQKTKLQTRATSLIEIILYFTLLGIFLVAAMIFAIQIMNVSSLSSNSHELQSNLDFILQKITYSIQTAESIDDAGSTFDSDQGVLSLNMTDPDLSPTVISFSDGDVLFREGLNPAVQLNSSEVEADQLHFQKITYEKTPDQIVIDASFSPSIEDLSNLQTDYPIHLSISLRQ